MAGNAASGEKPTEDDDQSAELGRPHDTRFKHLVMDQSEKERRERNKALVQRHDEGGTATRGVVKAKKEMDDADDSDVHDSSAPKKVGKRMILQSDRPSWSTKIYTGDKSAEDERSWWEKRPNAKCVKCQRTLGVGNRSIDHIIPWAKLKLDLDDSIVCKNGVHWRVCFIDDARKAYEDDSNLQPTCPSCNSEKGGIKGNATLAPNISTVHKDDKCKGDKCNFPKADEEA
jgi:5-methylcytosine-specific restriction endonuclease McrA